MNMKIKDTEYGREEANEPEETQCTCTTQISPAIVTATGLCAGLYQFTLEVPQSADGHVCVNKLINPFCNMQLNVLDDLAEAMKALDGKKTQTSPAPVARSPNSRPVCARDALSQALLLTGPLVSRSQRKQRRNLLQVLARELNHLKQQHKALRQASQLCCFGLQMQFVTVF